MAEMGIKMKFEYLESSAFSKRRLHDGRLDVCKYIGDQMKVFISPPDQPVQSDILYEVVQDNSDKPPSIPIPATVELASNSAPVSALGEDSILDQHHQLVQTRINCDSQWISRVISFHGIVNEGNTCFLNAVLQCIASISPLLQYLTRKLFNSKPLWF
jgi:hypothetical protein